MSHPFAEPGQQSGLTPCYRGSVNQWECDENDHLNVRFYAHKINQALQTLLTSPGHAVEPDVLARIRSQHIRFLRECRSATPLRVDCGVLGADAERVELLALMHHNLTGEVMAAFTTVLTSTPADAALLAAFSPVAVPDFARPRGVLPEALPALPETPAAAVEQGYRCVGQGVIGRDECDAGGSLLPHGYIGRISDGMPNLWANLNSAEELAARHRGAMGGAALEQRLEIHAPLRQGVLFLQMSGVRSLGNKTQNMSHLLFDISSGCLAASAEAVGVAMDLTTRRAVEISPERRQRMQALLLRP